MGKKKETGRGEHSGHTATAAERIVKARGHYETRRDRRPAQVAVFVGPDFLGWKRVEWKREMG